MLMTQFVAKLLNHGVHLVFELELFLFQPDFFDVILFGHVMAAEQFVNALRVVCALRPAGETRGSRTSSVP